jgi:hypothetical protein
MNFQDPTVRWEDLVIWKMDLRGAHTLINFRTEDVRLMSSEMTGDLIIFFICGIFGWIGTPAAFQVVTRTLLWELTQVLVGLALMYVDDIIGVCLRKDMESEMEKTRVVCTDLLGSQGVELKKNEFGTRLKVIGYDIDMDLQLATVSRKNLLRALHGFLTVDLDQKVSVPFLQKLASWGSRYSYICPYFKLFLRALYNEYTGKDHSHSITLSENARRAIRFFRVLFLLLPMSSSLPGNYLPSIHQHLRQ